MQLYTTYRLRNDALLVWSDERTLQLGVDAPILTIQHPSPTKQRMLTALVKGATTIDLAHIASPEQPDIPAAISLIERLKPALESNTRSPDTPGGVLILDSLNAHASLASHFSLLGVSVSVGSPGFPRATKHNVVSVERFFHDTYAQQYWLSNGTPLLPVRYSDRSVHIGPMLSEEGPCGNCLNSHLADEHPNWRRVASQLIGRFAPTETPALAGIITALALRTLREYHASTAPHQSVQYVVHSHGSQPLRVNAITTIEQHPECRYHEVSLAS